MIKVETLGMLDVAKVNPVLKHTEDVKNYSFLTVDDELYLISNTITGDNAYREDVTIPAGEYLNGFLVRAWDGQKLVVDGKHIQDKLTTLSVGDTLEAQTDGTLKKVSKATGVHLVITDKGVTLTEAAVKAKVAIAASTTTTSGGDS